MMYYINLDPPSEDIITECRNLANKTILSDEINDQNFHDTEYTVNYAHTGAYTTGALRQAMRDRYQHLFKWTISASIIMIENHSKYPIASFATHIDSKRCAAINWYIDLGGSDTRMTFYNRYGDVGDNNSLDKIYNTAPPAKHEILSQFSIEANKWYTFNAQQYHSGENIETKRLILVSRFENSIYAEFMELYKHLMTPVPPIKNPTIRTYLKDLKALYG